MPAIAPKTPPSGTGTSMGQNYGYVIDPTFGHEIRTFQPYGGTGGSTNSNYTSVIDPTFGHEIRTFQPYGGGL